MTNLKGMTVFNTEECDTKKQPMFFGKPLGVQRYDNFKYPVFDKCVNEEKKWAEYLFKDGSMIGLNDKLLFQYVEWIANKRMRAIGLKPIYDAPIKNNPLPWTEHWISSKGLQVAPQETEVESYIVGGIKQDVKKDTFSGFKL